MAILENNITGERINLRSHHVFGRRKAGTDTVLSSRDISQVHASIRWEGDSWSILDHSRNGTWIDGHRLNTNSVHLKKGNTIRFGGAEQSSWKIKELSAPATVLVPMQQDLPVIELTRFHVLPNDDNPEISIYASDSGQWICESEQGSVPLSDGDIVRHQDKIWRFNCAGVVDSTMEAVTPSYTSLNDIMFKFRVSLDEEHVFVEIQRDDRSIELGERAHHYMLLTLARKRLEDARTGADPDSHGWVELEDLAKMLGMEHSHLNIQIFRVRKQVAQAMPDLPHMPHVVERRVGSVRFGYANFEVFRGSKIECQLNRNIVV